MPPEWIGTVKSVPETTVPELFQAQIKRTPDAAAVTDGAEVLSYAVLNARANRLARYLISVGAGPGQLVAVAMERSADLVAALLAVREGG